MAPLGVLFVFWECLEPENRGLQGEPAAESVFSSIWGQILGCLGLEKHGFRARKVAISHFSQDLIFFRFWGLFWRPF